jgi:hypothetical protein
MISLDSSHGPTMENPPEKDRDAAPLLSPELRSPPIRPGGKAPPSSEICERWPDAEPCCCCARVKFSWDDGGFIFLFTLLLAVEGW